MSGTSRTKVTPTSSTSTSATCGTRSIVRSDAIRSRPCAVPATGSALSRADALADAGDAGLGGPDGRRPGRDRRLRLPAVTDRAPANRRRDPAVEGACRASGRGGDGFAPARPARRRVRAADRSRRLGDRVLEQHRRRLRTRARRPPRSDLLRTGGGQDRGRGRAGEDPRQPGSGRGRARGGSVARRPADDARPARGGARDRGPLALVLAVGVTWLLVGWTLRPVESMRAEAAAISAGDPGRRLPVPGTGDELARLAQTLNAMLGRLEEAIERERRFVDDASHELRTPLSNLKAELDVALRRSRTSDELE